MKRIGLVAGVVLLMSTLAWAGSVSYFSTWKNPNFSQLDTAGRKVAVFVINQDESMRLGPEETLATELRSRGVDCVAGYTVLPAELAKDQEKAKAFLKKVGLTDAILIRVVGTNEELHYMPGTAWYAGPYYQSFWGYWNYGWSAVYSPGYIYSNTVVTLETLIFSVSQDTLMWAGACKATNPEEIRKLVKDVANATGKKIRKEGLMKK